MPPTPIKSLPPDALSAWLAQRGHPAYRAAQLNEWLYRHGCRSFEEMATIPKSLRGELAAAFLAFTLECLDTQQAGDDTRKFLYRLPDGETIESVLVRAPYRDTVCVSTQVGCPVRCAFCASGRFGLVRNLESGEIIDQVIAATRDLGHRVSHVVVMGMGEPLLNLEALVPALDAICDPDRLGIGARHVTVSTSGIVPGIRHLAGLRRQWNLALSLHATSDQARAAFIPDAHRFPLEHVLAACAEYRERTGRMVTLEYALIAGGNDSAEDTRRLADMARGLHAKVNLIPCNSTGSRHRPPDPEQVRRILDTLRKRGVRVTVRREKGAEIQAACGQLRARRLG